MIPPIGDKADCPAEHRERFYCTLDAGHAGPHVAHMDDHEAAAIWDDADTPTPDGPNTAEPGEQP